ncbi:unnamed protein product, partial [Ilex paraguariensis]
GSRPCSAQYGPWLYDSFGRSILILRQSFLADVSNEFSAMSTYMGESDNLELQKLTDLVMLPQVGLALDSSGGSIVLETDKVTGSGPIEIKHGEKGKSIRAFEGLKIEEDWTVQEVISGVKRSSGKVDDGLFAKRVRIGLVDGNLQNSTTISAARLSRAWETSDSSGSSSFWEEGRS